MLVLAAIGAVAFAWAINLLERYDSHAKLVGFLGSDASDPRYAFEALDRDYHRGLALLGLSAAVGIVYAIGTLRWFRGQLREVSPRTDPDSAPLPFN
jgi:hypothetical protein